MKQFTPKTFNIPALKGISAKTIEEHLKLYQGYVKNLNAIYEKMDAYAAAGAEDNAYALNEFMRRISFEYNGMRNHEVYFASLEGGSKPLESLESASETRATSSRPTPSITRLPSPGGTISRWTPPT